jgi:acyl carrier protein
MTDAGARDAVARVLAQIAPEAELDLVDPAADLRTELDLDSIDFLNLVEGLKEETGVEIPESDYAEVRSLDGLVAYITGHAA